MVADVWNAVHIVAVVIQRIGMHIDLVAMSVGEDKVTFTGVVASLLVITAGGEQLAQQWHMLVRQGDVKIAVGPGLFPQQRVYCPTAIDLDFQAILLQKPTDLGSVVGNHRLVYWGAATSTSRNFESLKTGCPSSKRIVPAAAWNLMPPFPR